LNVGRSTFERVGKNLSAEAHEQRTGILKLCKNVEYLEVNLKMESLSPFFDRHDSEYAVEKLHLVSAISHLTKLKFLRIRCQINLRGFQPAALDEVLYQKWVEEICTVLRGALALHGLHVTVMQEPIQFKKKKY